MRVIDQLTTANSNLLRSKLRTSLTILAIIIGAFTFAMSLGLSEGVRGYITSQIGQYENSNLYEVTKKDANIVPASAFSKETPEEYDPDASKGITDFAQIFLSPSQVEAAANIEGVENFHKPYGFSIEYVVGKTDIKYSATGSVVFPEIDKTLLAGRSDLEELDDEAVLLSSEYIEALGFQSNLAAIGETITVAITNPQGEIEETALKVRGVIEPSLFDQAIGVNEATALKLATLQKGDLLLVESFASVYVSKSSDITEEDFKANFDAQGLVAQSIKDAIGALNTIIDIIQYGLAAFSSVALLAAVVGVINTLFMSVLERTKEIGLFRAMGASKRTVFTLFSLEALLIGFWGSVLGLLISNIAAAIINNVASSTFLKGVEGFQLLELSLNLHLLIIVAISVITLVAGILPAFKAARLNPIEALKYE